MHENTRMKSYNCNLPISILDFKLSNDTRHTIHTVTSNYIYLKITKTRTANFKFTRILEYCNIQYYRKNVLER